MWQRQGNIFNAHHAQVPVIELQDTLWRIYYTTRICNQSVPLYFDVEPANPKNILYKHTDSLLSCGGLGTFDVNGILTTDVVNIGKQKFMYYIGWVQRKDVKFQNAIGLAIYKNNEWVKFSDGPIFNSSYKDAGTFSGVSRIIKNNIFNEYVMFYSSTTKWEQINGSTQAYYNLKYALSKNGIDWEPKGVIVDLKHDEGGITSPSIVKYNNYYLMWFSVRKIGCNKNEKTGGYTIKCMRSVDLIGWEPCNILNFQPDINSNWDNEMVAFPYVFLFNQTLYMFYSGNGFGACGIGYATLKISELSTLM